MAKRRFGRRSLEISREEKLLFPAAGLSKGALIDYYQRIAERILPHLRERPLVLQRFPDGIEADGFYQKQVPASFPDWIERATVEVESTGERQSLVVCQGRASLAYLANQACLSLHPWLSRRADLHRPDLLVFDLDPPGDDFALARWAALRLRALLDALALPGYPKLTGSRGVHVVVPLDGRAGFDAVRAFARDVAETLAAQHPDTLTTEQRRRKRQGRLYLDIGRNAYAQTAVAPWSIRPLPEAPVAVPLTWRDLEREKLGPRDYTVQNVFRRFARRGDPWEGMRRRARSLGPARDRLAKLRERGA